MISSPVCILHRLSLEVIDDFLHIIAYAKIGKIGIHSTSFRLHHLGGQNEHHRTECEHKARDF